MIVYPKKKYLNEQKFQKSYNLIKLYLNKKKKIKKVKNFFL